MLWVFIAAHWLSLVVVNGGHSLGVVCRLLIAVTSLLFALRNQKMCVTHFIVILTVLQGSRNKLEVSLRYACTCPVLV